MEIAVGIAIGVLVVVLLFSTVGIVFLMKTKCCKKKDKDHISHGHAQNKPGTEADVDVESPGNFLIDDGEDNASITLQNVLDDDIWIDDMSGVMNHCLPILRGCHELTSQLVPITQDACQTEQQSDKIEELACKVTPRLDDVVQLLEGPLDPRLVEARCTALYFAVCNLCLVIKSICTDEGIADWIDGSLKGIEEHLQVLQEATQKLRQRTLSRSASAHAGDDSSPVSNELAATHSSNSSRGSSTRTDSTESGIDMRSEIGGGPGSPQYKLKLQPDQDNNLVEEKQPHTVVEVHDHNQKQGQQQQGSEVIEMCEMNGGYVDDSEIEIDA